MRDQEHQLTKALSELARLRHNVRCGEKLKEKKALEFAHENERLDLLTKQELEDIEAQEAIVRKVIDTHPEYLDDYGE